MRLIKACFVVLYVGAVYRNASRPMVAVGFLVAAWLAQTRAMHCL
jgi:uncharacterized membrane protein YjdF